MKQLDVSAVRLTAITAQVDVEVARNRHAPARELAQLEARACRAADAADAAQEALAGEQFVASCELLMATDPEIRAVEQSSGWSAAWRAAGTKVHRALSAAPAAVRQLIAGEPVLVRRTDAPAHQADVAATDLTDEQIDALAKELMERDDDVKELHARSGFSAAFRLALTKIGRQLQAVHS